MMVDTAIWEKVTIDYEKPVGREKEKKNIYDRAYVFFDSKDKSLKISSKKTEKSILLARAVLISLSPWEAVWEAYWWSSVLRLKGKDGKMKFIKAKVHCEF